MPVWYSMPNSFNGRTESCVWTASTGPMSERNSVQSWSIASFNAGVFPTNTITCNQNSSIYSRKLETDPDLNDPIVGHLLAPTRSLVPGSGSLSACVSALLQTLASAQVHFCPNRTNCRSVQLLSRRFGLGFEASKGASGDPMTNVSFQKSLSSSEIWLSLMYLIV